jgi:hypothetical protein
MMPFSDPAISSVPSEAADMLSGKTRVSATVTGDAACATVANAVSEMAHEAAEEAILRPMSYAMSFLQHAAKESNRPKKIDDRPQTRTGWLSNFRVTSLCPAKYSGALLPMQHRRRGGRSPSRFALFTRQRMADQPASTRISLSASPTDRKAASNDAGALHLARRREKRSGEGGGAVRRRAFVQADL